MTLCMTFISKENIARFMHRGNFSILHIPMGDRSLSFNDFGVWMILSMDMN